MLQHNGRMLATSGVCNDKKVKTSRTLKLLGTASVLASALVLANSASAQSVPEDCTVTPNPLASGSTILCVSSAPITGPVSSPGDDGVEDLTVVIGSADTATVLATESTTAVTIIGNGPQTLNVVNAASEVGGGVDGAILEVTGGSGALTVNAQGRIVGAGNGLVATNNGSGLTSITTGNVQGSSATGIVANVFGDGGASIDTTGGTVNGSQFGMRVVNDGSGDATIKTAAVRSYSYDGILASSYGSGDLSIDTTAGDVLAGRSGISVNTNGEGSVSITTGDVSSRFSDAVRVDSGEAYYAFGEGAPGTITINTAGGTIFAGDDGIDVEMPLGGDVSITTADVYGESVGIDVSLGGYYGEGLPTAGDLTINTTAGTVTGTSEGIQVNNRGTGSISIVTADVTGETGEAIEIFNGRESEGAITIDSKAGTLTGGTSGIGVDNNGSGALTITTADVVSTGYERSYYYYDYYSGEGETITRVYGDAAIRVNSNYGSTGAISINTTAGVVSGFEEGIEVNQRGSGAIAITTADVTGRDSDAIRVNADYGESRATSLPITVNSSAGTLTSTDDGIDVESNGGAVTITTADIVARGDGIEVDVGRNYYYYGEGSPVRPSGNITINTVAGSLNGESDGIDVDNRSGGSVSVTTADVTAQYGESIRVNNGSYSSGGVAIDSTAGTLTGGESGIFVYNGGAGGISVNTADVTSTGWERSYTGYYGEVYTRTYGGSAIVLNNGFSSSGDVTVDTSAGAVTGFRSGIEVSQNGSGDVSIITSDVTGQDGAGIEVMLRSRGPILSSLATSPAAVEESAAPSVTIDTTAGSVIGEEVGISVYGETGGAITIKTADVTGQYGPGIAVRHYGSTAGGVSIDTTAGAVAGNGYAGITVRSSGSGNVQITTADVYGEVVGVDVRKGGYFGEGYGYGSGATGSIVIDTSAGAASGGIAGIGAFNSGEGGIDITTADASGRRYGILARNNGASQSGIAIDTTAGTVASGDIGILAQNDGLGGIAIKTAAVTGGVEGESYSRYGGVAIGAFNGYSSEGGITIDTTAGAVTGGEAGIAARNSGLGGISITTADVTATGGSSGYYGEGGGYYLASNAGIIAVNGGESTGGITINSVAGSISGGEAGISATNFGTGGITITTADVTAIGTEAPYLGSTFIREGVGISVRSGSESEGAISVNSTGGSIDAGKAGIDIVQDGAGGVSVKTNDITSTGTWTGESHLYGTGFGIIVNATGNSTGDVLVDTSAGDLATRNVGIDVQNSGNGRTTVIAGDITSTNGGAIHLRKSGAGSVTTIQVAEGATVTSDVVTAIAVTDFSGFLDDEGAILISGAGAVTGRAGISVNSINSPVTISKLSSVVGVDGPAISVTVGQDPITITDVGTITGTGATSMLLSNNGGTISVQGSGRVGGITSDTAQGIVLNTMQREGSSINLGGVAELGTVIGKTSGIEVNNTGFGSITIAAANVTGQTDRGISVSHGAPFGKALSVSSSGQVTGVGVGISVFNSGTSDAPTTVAVNNVTATGTDSIGIYARGRQAVTVGSTGTVTAAGTGIIAQSFAGATTVTTNNVTATQAGSIGIQATAPGAVSVTSTGLVQALGTGILASSGESTTAVVARDVTVTGTASKGIDASGLGNVSVATTGTVSAVSTGILATSSTGTTTVSANNVTGTGANSIGIQASGPGAVGVTSTGLVQALGTGILANSGESTTAVSARNVTVTGAASKGIDASGPGNVLVTATGTIAAVDTGIQAASSGGTTTVNANSVNVTGAGSKGIDASGSGNVSVTTTGTVAAVGTGIFAASGAGTTNVSANNVTATGAGSIGIQAIGSGAVGVTSTGLVQALGTGILANGGTSTTVTANAVTVTTAGAKGIDASGPGNVLVSASGTIAAVDTGIRAASSNGTATVNASAVTATGAASRAIDVSGSGAASVTTTGAIAAVGTGIRAASSTGSTTVNSAAVTVTGTGSIGIDASGAAAMAVTSTGAVSAVGTGIRVVSTRGPATVTAGSVTATSGPAIDVSIAEGGTGNLVVTTTGTVRGGSAGIAVSNLGTGTTTLNNSGSLSATSGPVLRISGRPVVGTNSGTLTGYVVLTAGNDVLNNSGTILMTGSSDFGGGNDVLNNTGTILVPVQNGPSAAIETVGLQSPITLTGLETLNNSGLIDLRNGQIGNRLVQPGSYVGSANATLALDAVLGPTLYASDTFVVGGAATGSTVVQVNFVGNSGNLPAFDDIVLVNAGAGSSASAFTLGNIASTDLLRLGLRFDSTSNDYLLVAGPSAAAYRTSLYAEGFRNVWNMAADNVTRHLAAVRDDVDEEPATPIWLAMTGDQVEREILQPFTQIGFNAIDDLSYDQSYFGLQLGVDLGKGPLSYGVTVGYMTGLQEFSAGQQVDYSSANIGVYADVQSGPLFANIIAKYDKLWATAQNVITQPEVDLDGSTWGARAEIGVLLGDRAALFAEPAVSLSYTSSDLDDMVTPQGSFTFAEDEGLLGKAGGRLGAALGSNGSVYIGGNYVREFAGEDSVVFQSGNRTFNLQASGQRDYAEGRLGLNFGSSDGAITATLEGRIATGGGREGAGGSATVKFRF